MGTTSGISLLLYTFLRERPELCACVKTLTISDDTAVVSKERKARMTTWTVRYEEEEDDQAEGDDSDEDEGGGDDDDDSGNAQGWGEDSEEYWTVYRCAVDPVLIRRTLACFPHLEKLHLKCFLPPTPLARSALSAGDAEKLVCVNTLHVSLPEWDGGFNQITQIFLNILSVFDGVSDLRLKVGNDDTKYQDMNIVQGQAVHLSTASTPYKIDAFSNSWPRCVLLRAIAGHPAFGSLSTLTLGDSGPEGLNELLAGLRSSLTHLAVELSEPFPLPGRGVVRSRSGLFRLPMLILSACPS